ncbi:conserved hypothetical protein [Burkholderiales bacterium 8X]|nr:conserved hypothetical protein [Burkholderiales bacterium 8X]
MTSTTVLKPASEIAAANPIRLPNESAEYRQARTALLAEEIELRRHIERVAAQRRALPPGGAIPKNYRFEGAAGPVDFEALFGDKDTLIVYSFMYGPKRKSPCPMCSALMAGWDGEAVHVEQRASLVFTARSPIDRIMALQEARGWKRLRLYSDSEGSFTRDYVNPEDGDSPAFNVFTRRDGTVRHFWTSEMYGGSADPGQDPRGAPDLMSLWTILDSTPEGRGADWYPKLDYS